MTDDSASLGDETARPREILSWPSYEIRCRGLQRSLEAHPQPQPERPRRGAEHRFLVVQVDRGRGDVVLLLAAPALVDEDRPLGVQQIEDVEEDVDRRRSGG